MSTLLLCSDTVSFFRKLVDSAVINQELQLSEELRIYLVELLVRGQLLIEQDKEFLEQTPLSVLYLEAFKESLSSQRIKFKFVGDYSLYLAGYFGDSFNGKIIDPSCYVMIGSSAFNSLSSISKNYPNSQLYSDIVSSFEELVDILTEVSFDTMVSGSEDLVKLYNRWSRTGSKVLKRKLIEKGMVTGEDDNMV